MSATDKPTAAANENGFESLTITLQQIAASAQNNSDQFESQKKQFFEQFSKLFGSLNSLKQKKDKPSTSPQTNNVLSPSTDSPTIGHINRVHTPTSTTPLIPFPNFKKSSSFPLVTDTNSIGNPSVPNTDPNKLFPSASIPNLLPINTLNLTPMNNATNAILTPQHNSMHPMPQHIAQLSVPMSIISNTSHSTMYQYPYITSAPNPNATGIMLPSTIIQNNNALLSAVPNPPKLQTSTSTNSNTTAYESYWMRRILSNILLLLFRYHPNGVLECELSQFYNQMFNEELVLTMDLKYLLCVHKSILITNTKERGQLYTLNDDEIGLFLQEFDSGILQQWIIKHIRRLFRCFPSGIACHCLEDLLFNMVQFKLSSIIQKWHEFVCNIPAMYCCNINGINMFIIIDLDSLNAKYTTFMQLEENKHVITSNNIQYYLSSHLTYNNILRRPVGYCELLIVLMSSYYTTDTNNPYYKGIGGETLEKAFHSSYQSRLVHEAPFIQHVLGKICEITVITGENNDNIKLYKLLSSSKQYYDTQPDCFAPILNRRLELMNNKAPLSIDTDDLPQSPFKEDHVSVFMGGFSHGTTVDDLRIELSKQGITLISSSGISYRNYGWSFVTLSNDKEAQYLISISPIQIMGRMIDIRPFINRQRVRNHIANKPSDEAMLNAMIDLLNKSDIGATVADIQSKLFRKFSYRIDGPELTKIVGDNPKHLYIRRHQTERIYCTPKLPSNMSKDDLMIKINKLWKHINCNYRGNVYNEQILQHMKDGDEEQKEEEDIDGDTTDTGTIKSPKSSHSSLSADCEAEYTISEDDFENEFARRYRVAIYAKDFGFDAVKPLLESMNVPFKVIIYKNPVCVSTFHPSIRPYTTISGGFNKNHLNHINVNHNHSHNSTTKTNMTSPRYINSPSNYSNHSFKSPSATSNTNISSPFAVVSNPMQRNIMTSPPNSQSNVYAAVLQYQQPQFIAANMNGSVTNYAIIPSRSVSNSNCVNMNAVNMNRNNTMT